MRQKFFDVPFAVSGDQTPIVDASNPDGVVTFTDGWGEDYSLELADPSARKIDRASTNYLFYVITNALRALQAVGVPEWITTADNSGTAFPYEKGAHVRYSSDPTTIPFVEYVSTVDNNTSVPGADTNWQVALVFAASQAEVLAGTVATKAVTPLSLQNLFPLAAGTAHQIPVQTGVGTTGFIAAPTTSGTGLQWNGTNFIWVAASGGGTGRLLSRTYYTCLADTVTFSGSTVTRVGNTFGPTFGAPLVFSTTGSLPSPLVAGTIYYSAGSTNISATPGGAAITFSGAGTGTHSVANAPYVKSVNNPSFIRVIMVGGGGAGGGCPAATICAAGGGSAGAVIQYTFPAAALSASEAITVGLGGVGVSGAAGGQGASSIFGTPTKTSAFGGNSGPLATSALINIGGAPQSGSIRAQDASALSIMNLGTGAAGGGPGMTIGTYCLGGRGGSSDFGPSIGAYSVQNGTAADGNGGAIYCGAGGNGSTGAIAGAATKGGNGSPGLVIIEEYS